MTATHARGDHLQNFAPIAPRHHPELPELNGLRGLAVLIVFASHASNFFLGGKLTGYGGGQLGVMLFFMLSGFLMALIYLGQSATFRHQLGFAVSRLARIYPLYATVVIASYLLVHFGSSVQVYPIKSVGDLLAHLGFVHGIGALHTIGPEVIFYLMFMLLWKLHDGNLRAFAVTMTVMAVVGWLPVDLITSTDSLRGLHDRVPFFLTGMLLAMVYPQMQASAQAKPLSPIVFWLAFGLFLAALPQTLKLWVDLPRGLLPKPWSQPWSYPFYLLVTAALFVATLMQRPRFLTGRVMGYLGTISFGFYLLHAPVLLFFKQVLPSWPWLAIALGLILSTALAALLHAVLEAPARRFFRRLLLRRIPTA